MSGRVAGKVVIVSGGARGMGAAHARRLAAEGAHVVIGDVLTAEGEALAGELCADHATFTPLDVTRESDWLTAVTVAERAYGRVTGLVNNAGIVVDAPIEELTEADYRRVVDVNQVGTFLGMKSVLASMRAAGGGSVVNVSSAAGLVGLPGILPYTASKWAIRGMTKTAAVEFAPYGIGVNSVHPGLVETPMTAANPGTLEAAKHQPLPRAGRPEELAAMVLFLLSDESGYATGAEFVVDGGFTAQ